MSNTDYNAVNQADGNTNEDFDVENTYYVQKTELTEEQKRAKCVTGTLPIVIATVVVIGFAIFFASAVHLFAPKRSGTVVTPVSVQVPAPAPAPKAATTFGGGSSQCAAHSKCASTGLSGACCPTPEGVVLNCCN